MLLLSLFTSIGVRAQYVTGDVGNGIHWMFSSDTGSLTISADTGSDGVIPDYGPYDNKAPWINIQGVRDNTIREVNLGYGITRIGSYAFYGQGTLENVKSIKLPSAVTSIGRYAFCGSLLKSITLNEGLESIDDDAFYNCPFESLFIPKTVTNIGKTILSSTNGLKIEEGNQAYTSRDADGKECNVIIETATNTLKNVYDVSTIPQNVEAIGDGAFFSCNFTEIEVPAPVKTIGKEAFDRCYYLRTLTIGENVTSIGDAAFAGLNNLETLVFNGTEPPTFGTDCFRNCNANLTVSVPADHSVLAAYKEKDELKSYSFTIHGSRFYAVVDANNTLTFRYDSKLDFGTDVSVYEFDNFGQAYNGTSLDNMMTSNGYSNGVGYIKTVDFDESVADFRPTSCAQWFYRFSSLTAINNIDRLNTQDVKSMNYMFGGCAALKNVDLSSFNTEKVNNMQGMFSDCHAMESLDLRSFNTANVYYMGNMFQRNLLLRNIFVTDAFTTEGLYNDETIFSGCSLLTTSTGKTAVANYNTDNGNFKKVVGTLGGELLGARGKTLTIDELTLTDNKPLVLTETAPVQAAKAQYSRTMKSKWGTLCLPYSINADDEEASNCLFYAVEEKTDDAITLTQLTGNIEAGTPVIFCRKAGVTADAAINGSGLLATAAGTNGALVGTFETKTLDDADYFIASDAFRLAADYKSGDGKGVKVAPYRAYIQTQGGAQASVLRIMGGQATGISSATADDLGSAAAQYYTIDGRRTDSLQKGLNIVKVGGKTRKVIVK